MITKSALSALVLAGAVSLGACTTESPVAPARSANAPSLARSGTQATFGNLIAALNNIAVNIDELSALNNLTIGDVTLVRVGDVLSGNNIEALNNALNNNNVEILNLRNVLNNNTILTDFLKNNKVAIGQVVAIDVLSGGDVIVFAQ